MKSLRLITLAGDTHREPEIAARITQEHSLELVLRCVDRVEALAAIRGGAIDLVLSIGCAPWFDFQCLTEARLQGVRVMGIAGDPVEVEMLENGGIEVVPAETALSRLAELARSAAPPETAVEGPPPAGKLIAVWGAKGAPGRTSIAIELATTLSASDPATLLADADLYGGDVLQLLGVIEELPSIVAVARRAAKGELTGTQWPDSLHRAGPTGPVLLPGLLRAELWEEVSAFGWEAFVAGARAAFRFSVVDVGFCLEADPSGRAGTGGRNDVARRTVTEADHVVAIVRADPVGIKNFLWALSDAQELQIEEKLLVVLNRVHPGDARDLRSLLRRHLARLPVAEIPERPDLFSRSIWRGDPVAWLEPRSDVSEEMRNLTAALGGSVGARGFLTRLAGRGSRV